MDLRKQFDSIFGSLIAIVYVIGHMIIGPFSERSNIVFFIFMLIILGISHGAGDFIIAKKLSFQKEISFSALSFFVKYLGSMLVYAILWYFAPQIAFFVFIVLSIFHFGDLEDHATTKNSQETWIEILKKMSLGFGILSWILFFHKPEVNVILLDMKVFIPNLAGTENQFIPIGIAFCIALGFKKKNIPYFVNTCNCLILGAFIPLLPAFIIYFSGCHAWYSLGAMRKFLEIKNMDLIKKIIPFTILASLIGSIYAFLMSYQTFIVSTFIFLSLITLPHFWLMHQVVKINKRFF